MCGQIGERGRGEDVRRSGCGWGRNKRGRRADRGKARALVCAMGLHTRIHTNMEKVMYSKDCVRDEHPNKVMRGMALFFLRRFFAWGGCTPAGKVKILRAEGDRVCGIDHLRAR